ncbi:MAG: lamin tail domain-containing protein [Phycisphaerales bacterium]
MNHALVIGIAAGTLILAQPSSREPSSLPADAEAPSSARRLPAVDKPHPLICEILYAVPTGESGDASGDGTRSATGDEFIELVNPHDTPIELRGYTLTDRSMGKGNALKFEFPACTLAPGGVVVVFNGFETTFGSSAGESDKAGGADRRFHGARVFSMRATSSRQALSNTGDAVVLFAPDGSAVQRVKWGKVDGKLPDARLNEDAPTTNRGSVQRDGVHRGSRFAAHAEVRADGSSEGVRYSPGLFVMRDKARPDADPQEEADKPEPTRKRK